MRQALRGLLGCEHPALTREERERCHDRLAAGLQAGPARLNLDPTGRYLADPTPYLNRRTHNGCKARAAGDVAPSGEEGAAAGVACAWSF